MSSKGIQFEACHLFSNNNSNPKKKLKKITRKGAAWRWEVAAWRNETRAWRRTMPKMPRPNTGSYNEVCHTRQAVCFETTPECITVLRRFVIGSSVSHIIQIYSTCLEHEYQITVISVFVKFAQCQLFECCK